MPHIHEPQLVNMIGNSAGAALFGIFLLLLLRDRAAMRLRASWPSIAAAALVFLWNIGSLAALLTVDVLHSNPSVLIALSFSVLSLIPALLLNLSLDGRFPLLTSCGYGLSSIAVALHISQLITDRQLAQTALLLVTIGFGLLTLAALIALAVRSENEKRGRTPRMLAAMCSALFALSIVHFSQGHALDGWSKELIFHHAGIPLALFVLLQDYRFVLLDAFVRFLTNALLAALLTFGMIRLGANFFPSVAQIVKDPWFDALLLIAISFLLIVFAFLRGRMQRLLTRVVFQRPDLNEALNRLRTHASRVETEYEYLPWATNEIGAFMYASRSELSTVDEVPQLGEILFPALVMDVASLRTASQYDWAEAIAPLRLSPQETRYVFLGRRRGGRRYLSEDLQALGSVSTVVAEEVKRFRAAEMQSLVLQAELRALQSQINPHFLFNALNTLYGIIPREAAGARRTVMNLADIFRYSLQDGRSVIPISEELEIINAYLQIEFLRLGARLHTDIQVDDEALSVKIPILSIQPLVENAIKHGISVNAAGGWLRLKITVVGGGIQIIVEDTGAGIEAKRQRQDHAGAGLGLANVSKRLQLYYGPHVSINLHSDDSGTRVQFCIPSAETVAV